MENIIVALTNIPCIFPIYRSFIHHDYWTFAALTFVSIGSIVSHLIENHKHGMIGFPNISKETSYLWNRIDVLGSRLLIIRLLYLFYKKCHLSMIINHPSQWFIMLSPILFLKVSEYDKYNARLKPVYIVTHSIWHITVFLSIDYYLKRWIY